MLLKGKKALITGCNKGIGKSIFEKFIENEGEIIACVRNKSNEFEEFVNSKKKDHSIFIYEMNTLSVFSTIYTMYRTTKLNFYYSS